MVYRCLQTTPRPLGGITASVLLWRQNLIWFVTWRGIALKSAVRKRSKSTDHSQLLSRPPASEQAINVLHHNEARVSSSCLWTRACIKQTINCIKLTFWSWGLICFFSQGLALNWHHVVWFVPEHHKDFLVPIKQELGSGWKNFVKLQGWPKWSFCCAGNREVPVESDSEQKSLMKMQVRFIGYTAAYWKPVFM